MSKFKVGDKVVEISTDEAGVVVDIESHAAYGEMVWIRWSYGEVEMWCSPHELKHESQPSAIEVSEVIPFVIEYQGRKYKLMEE